MTHGVAAFLATTLFSINLTGPIGGIYNGVGDWLYFLDYQPPSEVSALATPMNDRGRRLFYRTDPELLTRSALNERCHIPPGEPLLELGCTTSDQHIYLVHIDRPELSAEERVVAAHEMLHEAYARLSGGKKRTLRTLIDRQLDQIHDPDLTARLEGYDRTEPGQRYNELHSILGTEYPDLIPELERYYAGYFADRAALVSADQQFDHLFSGLEEEIAALETRYKALRAQANTYLARSQISSYNALVGPINSIVSTYNEKVRYYNELAQTLKGDLGGVGSQ